MPRQADYWLLIICIPAAKQLINDTIRYADPESGGGDNVSLPLRLASNPTGPNDAAWAGSWRTDSTVLSNIRAAIRDAQWDPRPTREEQVLYGPSDPVPAFPSQRVWLFDGNLMTLDDALAVLGLARPYVPPRM